MTDRNTDAQAIIDTAVEAAQPSIVAPGDILSVVVPEGSRHEIVDLERYLEAPRRKRGRVQMFTAQSFGAYVTGHKDTGTALYADVEAVTIKAVLDGHITDGDAGWAEHTVTFTARLTPEWKAWSGTDGKWHNQASFAEFLEDNATDVVHPPAADLLELAKHFEATTGAQFKSAVRLDNGERQFTYVESIAASAGKSADITIPATIELGVVPFEGADRYRLNARFRYRIETGTLKLGIVLDRPDRVLRDAFENVLAEVETATSLKVFHGAPG